MRISPAILTLGLASLPSALGVKIEITEIRRTNGSEPRTEVVDIPYIDDSVLPKDQPCPALPWLIRSAKLLTDGIAPTTKCWLYTQYCHESLTYITVDDPEKELINASAFAARCYED